MYRLGGGEDDVKEIQAHPFFSVISWDDLVNKKVNIFYISLFMYNCVSVNIRVPMITENAAVTK